MPDLERFVAAQEPVMDAVLAQLRAGQKQTHWMWFVFPQLSALGRSPMAKVYGIADVAEACAYMAHPVLGPRLVTCTRLVNAVEGKTAHDIFGSPDELKFRSCLTLFHHAAPAEPAFPEALAKYYGGTEDGATVRLLPRGL